MNIGRDCSDFSEATPCGRKSRSKYDYIPNNSLTLRQHYDHVMIKINHFDLNNEFNGENKDRKRLVGIVIYHIFR